MKNYHQITTIGYEGVSVDAFVYVLRQKKIDVLVDIRDYPISRRRGFSKNALSDAVQRSGIQYVHFKELGNPKTGRAAARQGRSTAFKKIFARRLATKGAQIRVAEIIEMLRTEAVCLMCYERDHLECHRLLVAEEISGRTLNSIAHLVVPLEGRASSCLTVSNPVAS